ncbi:MAG: hemerythrin family protein [Alphaproteobacteria bacterium]|nr:hemerythrin family protein [Alphaproteobacteria bacterium]
MALLEWRQQFTIGVAEVDYEHRELIKLINHLHQTMVEGSPEPRIASFLAEIHEAIAAHFALEEKIMRDSRYQLYDEHKEDHEALLDEIREIMEGFDSGDYAAGKADLGGTLSAWFGRHFQTHDARLHRALG